MERKTAGINTALTKTETKDRKRVKRVTIKQFIDECPNHFNGRKGNIPDVISLHNTGGTKISSAHWWFLDPESQTSAHYLVGLDGEVRQYVNITDGAYCNGTTTYKNQKHCYLNATNGIVKMRSQNANLYTISIEFVGNVGDSLTEKQLEVAVELIRHIRNMVKILYRKEIPLNRLYIIGHYEIAPLTRGDCGKGIQYDEIINRLKGVPVDTVTHKKEEVPEQNPKTSDKPKIRKWFDIKKRRKLIK